MFNTFKRFVAGALVAGSLLFPLYSNAQPSRVQAPNLSERCEVVQERDYSTKRCNFDFPGGQNLTFESISFEDPMVIAGKKRESETSNYRGDVRGYFEDVSPRSLSYVPEQRESGRSQSYSLEEYLGFSRMGGTSENAESEGDFLYFERPSYLVGNRQASIPASIKKPRVRGAVKKPIRQPNLTYLGDYNLLVLSSNLSSSENRVEASLEGSDPFKSWATAKFGLNHYTNLLKGRIREEATAQKIRPAYVAPQEAPIVLGPFVFTPEKLAMTEYESELDQAESELDQALIDVEGTFGDITNGPLEEGDKVLGYYSTNNGKKQYLDQLRSEALFGPIQETVRTRFNTLRPTLKPRRPVANRRSLEQALAEARSAFEADSSYFDQTGIRGL